MTLNLDADSTNDGLLAESFTGIIVKAAAAIRTFDFRGVSKRLKDDRSPVTAADEAANRIILDELARLMPGVPVVSEESACRVGPVPPKTFILVDPLDGTSEFLAGRDEYTVNIALVRDGTPVVGLVAAPPLGLVWRGVVGRGAERLTFAPDATQPNDIVAIHTRAWPEKRVAAVSRSHYEAASAAFLARFAPVEPLACGSALKFARVAEGAADIYPRLAPTCDWDVAAGHALIVAAGGAVTTPQGGALYYGRTEDCHIPGFIAWGDPKMAGQSA